jgi:hypothetical protein
MSLADAQTVTIAIGAMWASAWAFKAIGRVIGPASSHESE